GKESNRYLTAMQREHFSHVLQKLVNQLNAERAKLKTKPPIVLIATWTDDGIEAPPWPFPPSVAKRYATRNSDGVVVLDQALGRGLDGKARIPGSMSIMIKGIRHFQAATHPL